MKSRTVVKHTPSGRMGVVVPDLLGVCSSQEVAVVLEGEIAVVRILLMDLKEIGPENAIADYSKCGVGEGEERCCVFFSWGPNGPLCDRFAAYRYYIMSRVRAGEMNAQRVPTALYPDCQLT
jgi:hypothetical protein